MALRVIQWTTGNVGQRALRAIVAHPELQLVGVYSHGTEKVGRDAAPLCGLDDPTGVIATNDIDALLALGADACCYTPQWPNVEEMSRLLAAGVNISSTAAFITGQHLGPEAVARINAAALRGNATIFGTGMNPGFANLFSLISAQLCDRVDQVRVLESVDTTGYASEEMQDSAGFGHTIGEHGLEALTERGTAVFGDAVAMTADALGVELDEISFDAQYSTATQDMDFGYMRIAEGTVAGIRANWRGRAFGRDVIVLSVAWIMGSHMKPEIPIRDGYFVEIDGRPSVRSRIQVLPPADWSEPGFMGLGMIMTAMPAVHAIPAVVAAPAGIATHATLPVVTARGMVGP